MPEEYYFREGCYITELHNTPDDPDVSVAQVRVLPGETTRWHALLHTRERYLIVSGSGIAEKEGAAPVTLYPGDVFTIEAGAAQRIRNREETDLIFLAVCTPRFQEENYLAID